MGIKQSIYEKPGAGNYYKMTPHHYQLVKQMWENIEKNISTYAIGFFVSLCQNYPKFLKYHSKEGKNPLRTDSVTSVRFTLILKTLGYIILDGYDDPKKLDKITGYIAMIHKDMRIDIQYFLDFTSHLVDFFSSVFPVEMTRKCQGELKNYLNSISYEIASKMEEFIKYEVVDLTESSGFLSCSHCSTNKLIFGQTLLYWKDRKRIWEHKMNEMEQLKVDELKVITSTEEDESLAFKSKTDDEMSELTEAPIISIDRQGLNPRTRLLTFVDSITQITEKKPERYYDFLNQSMKQTQYQLENFRSLKESKTFPNHVMKNTEKTPRQRFRERFDKPINFKNLLNGVKSDDSQEFDLSSARQRRRERVSN